MDPWIEYFSLVRALSSRYPVAQNLDDVGFSRGLVKISTANEFHHSWSLFLQLNSLSVFIINSMLYSFGQDRRSPRGESIWMLHLD
jgi:hypothetical protein